MKVPGQEPSIGGTRVCPSQDGATNWFSPSFNPSTGLYYVQTFEKCSIYVKSPGEWQSGKSYLGGSQQTADEPTPQRILRALDIQTGETRWELPQPGPAHFVGRHADDRQRAGDFGEEGGALMAVDATSGTPLWSFQTNQVWRASPMTYMFDGRQYIAVASGNSILAFALREYVGRTYGPNFSSGQRVPCAEPYRHTSHRHSHRQPPRASTGRDCRARHRGHGLPS